MTTLKVTRDREQEEADAVLATLSQRLVSGTWRCKTHRDFVDYDLRNLTYFCTKCRDIGRSLTVTRTGGTRSFAAALNLLEDYEVNEAILASLRLRNV